MELYGEKILICYKILKKVPRSSDTTELCEVKPKKSILTRYIHLYFVL
jgi:hypothetical protein